MLGALKCVLLALAMTAGSGTPMAAADSSNADSITAAAGDFIFADGFDDIYVLAPYASDGSIPPSPASVKLALSTLLSKWDVGFIVDTTGSMGGEVANLKTSLTAATIPTLKANIASLGVGIAGHDDVPYSTYGDGSGSCGDLPFYRGGYVSTITNDSFFAVNSLAIHCGSDTPEAQVPAIYHAITGSGITWPGGSVAPEPPSGATFGALHFRADALPIVISISDASQHNGKRALDKTGTTYDSAVQNVYSFSTWNVDDVVAMMNNAGAKFIGVAAGGSRSAGPDDPYGYDAYIADMTNSLVPPSAFVHGPGCAADQCCTALNGAGVAVDGPGSACRTVFSLNTNGSGLGNVIVDGVNAIRTSVKFDVYVQAYNDALETTDVVGNFVLKVEPDPNGGTDPRSGGVCLVFPAAQLADNFTGPDASVAAPDGIYDTIKQINPAPLYCFNVVAKANSAVVATSSTQIFRAWLRILAIKPNGTLAVGQDRKIVFVVPPA